MATAAEGRLRGAIHGAVASGFLVLAGSLLPFVEVTAGEWEPGVEDDIARGLALYGLVLVVLALGLRTPAVRVPAATLLALVAGVGTLLLGGFAWLGRSGLELPSLLGADEAVTWEADVGLLATVAGSAASCASVALLWWATLQSRRSGSTSSKPASSAGEDEADEADEADGDG